MLASPWVPDRHSRVLVALVRAWLLEIDCMGSNPASVSLALWPLCCFIFLVYNSHHCLRVIVRIK